MNTLKIVGTPEGSAAQELQSSKPAQDRSVEEIRSLGDWELVLVGGGDVIPCWP
jgi:hypothetical protein